MNFESFKVIALEAAHSADSHEVLKIIQRNPLFSSRIFDIVNKNGDTIVHLAAQSGSVNILRYCFHQFGVKLLTQRNNDGKMPLHVAAQYGQAQCVEFLLSCNVPVDALKRSDWTPLMLACTKTDLNVVTALVTKGANLTYQNKDGWTAFHIAAREGCIDIVKYLLKTEELLWKTRSRNGRTPLHTAALHGNTAVVKLLLNETDHEIDPVDCCGLTPMMDAVCGSKHEMVKILADAGASVYKTDYLGKNLLHFAAEVGNVDCFDFLINKCDIDINSKTNFGLTALHYASKSKNSSCVKKLLELGADITTKDNKGRTARDYCTDEKILSLIT